MDDAAGMAKAGDLLYILAGSGAYTPTTSPTWRTP